jgi:two-component system nitrate/nitrite response regulator NarL
MTRVQIVAHIRLYREGIDQFLSRKPPLSVVGTSHDAANALRDAARLAPDIILIDMGMPGAAAFVSEVRQLPTPPKVVGLAVSDTEEAIIGCVRAGIAGYVPPDGSLDDLLNAIESVTHNEMLCPPRITAALARSLADTCAPTPMPLTLRERDVIDLVQRGWSNKQIAQQLHITLATVKNHIHHVLKKAGVRSRREVASHVRLTLSRVEQQK